MILFQDPPRLPAEPDNAGGEAGEREVAQVPVHRSGVRSGQEEGGGQGEDQQHRQHAQEFLMFCVLL